MSKMFMKKADGDKSSKDQALEKLKNILAKDNACYVLITCTEPSKEGNMDVEMSYQGDESLASYLLNSAQAFFEDDTNLDNTCKISY